MKKLTAVLLLLATAATAFAQTNTFPASGKVGIGTTVPNASSLLEVKSTTKGVLFPRMTKTQRDLIPSPATGLLMYQTDNTAGFYYFTGSAWTALKPSYLNKTLNNLTTPTAINTSLLPNNTNAIDLGSSAKSWKDIYFNGYLMLYGYPIINIPNGNVTGIGYNTLTSITTGNYNVALGDNALYSNTTGSGNVAAGSYALTDNYTGHYNTAMGTFSLENNYNGQHNSAFGSFALSGNAGGIDNTGIGFAALINNVSGSGNTACGAGALNDNVNSYNTAVGYSALANTSSSQYNTAVGYNSGDNYDNGYNNVFVGANVDVTAAGFYNVIAIGQGTVVNSISTAVFGNAATTGYWGWANWSNISDGRFKRNIQENVPGIDFISMLRPVTYTLAATELDAFQHRKAPMELSEEGKKFYDKALKEKEAITYTGLIAQEVETAAQSLGFDFSGVDKPKNDDGTYGLRYAEFVVPLIKAVQELNNTNEELKIQNEKLLRRMEVLENKNRAANSTLKTGLLQQNNPNPFNEKTVLKYDVPAFANQAVIKIYSSNGAEVISLPVSANGPGQTEISGETLSAGTYTYMLIVDGKAVDSKQMVLTK